MADQLIALGPAEPVDFQPVAEDTGQRTAPLGVTTRNPPGVFLEHWIRRDELRRHLRCSKPAAVHLVHCDQRRSPGSKVVTVEGRLGFLTVCDFDERVRQRVLAACDRRVRRRL